MTAKDRINELCSALNISKRELEITIGVSNGLLTHVNNSISKNLADKIEEKYPQVNIQWLRTGMGTMFHTPTSMVVSNEKTEEILKEIAAQRTMIERFQKQIDLCQQQINILLSTIQEQ